MQENKEKIFITKASGAVVPFSLEKLSQSLRRAGADENTISKIIATIIPSLYQGISTKKIYKYAFDLLKGNSGLLAARYRLKKAIMELGPSGFPFEKFIAGILRHQGYAVKIGEIVEGKCVKHEIDVIAEKDNQHFMVECKYHNQRGIFCDVKIPLYIQARFKDVEAQWLQLPGHGTKFHQGWVVTNTKFSQDAIQYGLCAGLHLLGWDYPYKNGLKDQIDSLGLYPVTCLTTLTRYEKQKLLNSNIVLCKEISGGEVLLSSGINPSRIKIVLNEVKQLCLLKDKSTLTTAGREQNVNP